MQNIIFSECKKCRYYFHESWGLVSSPCMFIGLNPSMSEGLNPTLRRCVSFAKSWGYDSCCVLNLFAARAATPADLRKISEPVGEDNNKYLLEASKKCKEVILVWGNHGSLLSRNAEIIKMFPDAKCLGLTKRGLPKHPLYLPKKTKRCSYKTAIKNKL